jgi:acyl-CoA thioesterase-1
MKRAALTALVAAALSGACGAQATSPSPSDPSARRIVVLGDSLSVTPTRAESFPAVLQTRIKDRGLNWVVTNAGISGDTTAGGLRRVDALLGNDVGVIVLELGVNDGIDRVALATIEQNLSSIIEKARGRGIDVLLCGMEVPPGPDFDYLIGFHNLFPRLAARYDLPLVPFLLLGVALNPSLNGRDGVHPNAAGAQRIAETVWPYLQPLLTGDLAFR